MPSGVVVVLASFQPRARKAAELRTVLQTMVENSRMEPGCEAYDFYESCGEPATYHLLERYSDAAALEKHRASNHYRAYRDRLPDLLHQPVQATVLCEVDVAR